MNTEQELLTMIDNILKAYDPESPFYKFKFVFYNKTDLPFSKPVDFPNELWYNSITKDNTLMPVLLKKNEIEQRRKEQLDTLKNLNNSYNFIQTKIDQLNTKSDRIRNKMYCILQIYRKIVNSVYNRYKIKKSNCNMMEEIEKINIDINNKELEIVDNRKDVFLFLLDLKQKLYKLTSRIDEALYEHERKKFVYQNSDRTFN